MKLPQRERGSALKRLENLAPVDEPVQSPNRRRKVIIRTAAGVALLGAVIGGVVAESGDNGSSKPPAATASKPTPPQTHNTTPKGHERDGKQHASPKPTTTTGPQHETPSLNLNANLCDSSELQSAMEQIFNSSSASCTSGGGFKAGIVDFEWTLPQASGANYVIDTNINDTRHESHSGIVEAPIDGPKSFFNKANYTQLPSVNGYECYDNPPQASVMACFVETGVAIAVNDSTYNYAEGGELVPITDQQFEAVGKAMVQAMQG